MLTQVDVTKLPSFELGMEAGFGKGMEKGMDRGWKKEFDRPQKTFSNYCPM